MLPEYGRHVHQMVDYLKTIHDRDLRNQQARAVIEVMGNLNPILRESADFKHKLWLSLIHIYQRDADLRNDVGVAHPALDSLILVHSHSQ